MADETVQLPLAPADLAAEIVRLAHKWYETGWGKDVVGAELELAIMRHKNALATSAPPPVEAREPACRLGCTATENCKAIRDGCGSECVAKPFQLRAATHPKEPT
jgi:hypothetical protein